MHCPTAELQVLLPTRFRPSRSSFRCLRARSLLLPSLVGIVATPAESARQSFRSLRHSHNSPRHFVVCNDNHNFSSKPCVCCCFNGSLFVLCYFPTCSPCPCISQQLLRLEWLVCRKYQVSRSPLCSQPLPSRRCTKSVVTCTSHKTSPDESTVRCSPCAWYCFKLCSSRSTLTVHLIEI